VDIQFSSSKLNRIFNSKQELLREYGKETSKKIRIRMAVLRSSITLGDVPKKRPDRCHGLKGNRIGQYAVDLNQPFRLVFKPAGTFTTRKDGSVDESTVTIIKILKVEDYH
jgi:proteic killer suppression protein